MKANACLGIVVLSLAAAAPAGAADLDDPSPVTDPTTRWLIRAGATALYAGAVTTAFVERDHEAGRVIATASVVPFGAAVGAMLGWAVAIPTIDRHRTATGLDSTGEAIKVGAGIAGALVGGAVAGLLAYDKASSPDARVPLTAVGFAPTYLMTLTLTCDFKSPSFLCLFLAF